MQESVISSTLRTAMAIVFATLICGWMSGARATEIATVAKTGDSALGVRGAVSSTFGDPEMNGGRGAASARAAIWLSQAAQPFPAAGRSADHVAHALAQGPTRDDSPDPDLVAYLSGNLRTIERSFKDFARKQGLIGFSVRSLRIGSVEVLKSDGAEHLLSVVFFNGQTSMKAPVVARFDDSGFAFVRKAEAKQSGLPPGTIRGTSSYSAIEFSGGN